MTGQSEGGKKQYKQGGGTYFLVCFRLYVCVEIVVERRRVSVWIIEHTTTTI